jgi:putative transcriptional regulator
MIRCHLSTAMGRAKMRITDVARQTGLNRSTVAGLYNETALRVELDTVNRLCRLFRCGVADLFEYVEQVQPLPPSGRRGRKS